MSRITWTILSLTLGSALALSSSPATASTDEHRTPCVIGKWMSTSMTVTGTSVWNGQTLHSEAHGGAGTKFRVNAASVELDYAAAAPELHNNAGEPLNSYVQYVGQLNAGATVTGSAQGTIALATSTATGTATATKTYLNGQPSVSWSVVDSVQLGGLTGNPLAMVPVNATFTCQNNTLVVQHTGSGTNPAAGPWTISATINYQRV